MIRRFFIVLSALVLLTLLVGWWVGPGAMERLANRIAPHEPWPVSAEAQRLHEGLVVGDLHADDFSF